MIFNTAFATIIPHFLITHSKQIFHSQPRDGTSHKQRNPRFAFWQIGGFFIQLYETDFQPLSESLRDLRKRSNRRHCLPFLNTADIRLPKSCALRELRLRQVFLISCAKDHHHQLVARFILISFFFEIRILHLFIEISIEIIHVTHLLLRFTYSSHIFFARLISRAGVFYLPILYDKKEAPSPSARCFFFVKQNIPLRGLLLSHTGSDFL